VEEAHDEHDSGQDGCLHDVGGKVQEMNLGSLTPPAGELLYMLGALALTAAHHQVMMRKLCLIEGPDSTIGHSLVSSSKFHSVKALS
jgi:hypothetical protein